MREIKFRAWHKESRKMYGVGYLHFAPNGDLYGLLADNTIEYGNLLAVTDFELMQFTGLQDKNGRDIYEGDFLLIEGFDTGIVEYGKACYMVRCGESQIALQDTSTVLIKVIGNVYENPEIPIW